MCDVSDHLPVFQFIHSSLIKSNNPKNEPKKYRKFSRDSIENFKSATGTIIWDEVLLSQDVNTAYYF